MPETRSIADAPSRWKLPTQCAVCRGWDASRICAPCLARFAPQAARCRRCAIGVPAGIEVCGACLREPPPFDGTLAAVDYDHPFDGLITRFKFHQALDLADSLARLLARAASAVPRPELVLPVPLSRERLRERGYNQSWEIARRVAGLLALAAEARLLLRVKDTPHQIALAPQKRAANVRSAFAVEPLRAAELRGRHVAIVDDVMTTGATAAEIARTLKQAGARRVELWVVARTPARDD